MKRWFGRRLHWFSDWLHLIAHHMIDDHEWRNGATDEAAQQRAEFDGFMGDLGKRLRR